MTVLAPPLAGNDSSVSAAQRHLILTGTHVSADPRDSLAFLGVDPRNPQTYANGALLVNGARLRAIAADHVLLEFDQTTVRVDIGAAIAGVSTAVARATRVGVVNRLPALLPATSTEPTTDALALAPVFDPTGQLQGYRLRPGQLAGVFERWGLRVGDLLVALDGAPVAEHESAMQLLGLVGGGLRLTGTVLRDGAAVPVVLDGALIEAERERMAALPVEPG
jgi:general secretion pathway protein C